MSASSETAKAVALEYLARWFTKDGHRRLTTLLHPDLEFEGPMFSGSSADVYLAALAADPPNDVGYSLHDCISQGDKVAVLYDFLKDGKSVPIAQFFTIREGRIAKMVLCFDSAQLVDPSSGFCRRFSVESGGI